MIDSQSVFKSILGNDVKISLAPYKTFPATTSLMSCALKCEFASGCKAFNQRSGSGENQTCDLFDRKETDIITISQTEIGSKYFEQVKQFLGSLLTTLYI